MVDTGEKKYWNKQIKSMLGPCLITFAIPLSIPGVTITFVAFSKDTTFDQYGAMHIVGILLLGASIMLLIIGCVLRVVWKSFVDPDLEVHLSPTPSMLVTSRGHVDTRVRNIYGGSASSIRTVGEMDGGTRMPIKTKNKRSTTSNNEAVGFQKQHGRNASPLDKDPTVNTQSEEIQSDVKHNTKLPDIKQTHCKQPHINPSIHGEGNTLNEHKSKTSEVTPTDALQKQGSKTKVTLNNDFWENTSKTKVTSSNEKQLSQSPKLMQRLNQTSKDAFNVLDDTQNTNLFLEETFKTQRVDTPREASMDTLYGHKTRIPPVLAPLEKSYTQHSLGQASSTELPLNEIQQWRNSRKKKKRKSNRTSVITDTNDPDNEEGKQQQQPKLSVPKLTIASVDIPHVQDNSVDETGFSYHQCLLNDAHVTDTEVHIRKKRRKKKKKRSDTSTLSQDELITDEPLTSYTDCNRDYTQDGNESVAIPRNSSVDSLVSKQAPSV